MEVVEEKIMDELKEKLLEYINENEVIELAKNIAKIPSFPPEEIKVAEFLAEFMKKEGLNVELLEIEPGRKQPLGRIKGTGDGPSLMFNGHMDIDVMPLGERRDPWKPIVKEGRLYGHGVGNMKAGVAAMVMAAMAIKRSGVTLKGNLIVAPVVGELQLGVGTDFLIKSGIIPDMAVVPEPTGLKIRTATAGVVQLLVNTIGKTVWGGTKGKLYEEAVDAMEKMCKVVKALKEASRKRAFTYEPFAGKPRLPRMVIGGMICGLGREHNLQRPSYVPDFCTISVDVRMVPSQTPESVRQDIEKVLEKVKADDPELQYEIEGSPAAYKEPWKAGKLFLPACNTSIDEYIVQVVQQNHKYVTGKDPDEVGPIPSQMAGNDSGHLFAAGVKAISYGPMYDTPSGEYRGGAYAQSVSVDQIVTCTKVLALTALDVCTKTKEEIK